MEVENTVAYYYTTTINAEKLCNTAPWGLYPKTNYSRN